MKRHQCQINGRQCQTCRLRQINALVQMSGRKIRKLEKKNGLRVGLNFALIPTK